MPQHELGGWVERTAVSLLRVAPLGTYGRLVRALADIPLPRRLRRAVFGRIASTMDIDLSEAEHAITEYGSFSDLFVRGLQPGRRPVDPAPHTVTSPVDGVLTAWGEAHQGGLFQAKGIDYSLGELVGSPALAARMEGAPYVTIYLRPRDYHRIHSPLAGRVVALRHIAGALLPVKPFLVRNVPGLFARNERLVLELETAIGRAVLVCVAAAGVGNISISVGALPAQGNGETKLDIAVEKGQELARFKLGSTVVLLLPPGEVQLAPLSGAQLVHMGEVLARRRDAA